MRWAAAALLVMASVACSEQAAATRAVVAARATPGMRMPGENLSASHLGDAGFGFVLTDTGRTLWTPDSGANWRVLHLPSAMSSRTYRAFSDDGVHWWLSWTDAPAQAKVAWSVDSGATWTVQALGLQRDGHGARSTFLDTNRGWLMVDEQQTMLTPLGELFGTTDGGHTWSWLSSFDAFELRFLNRSRGWAVSGPYATRLYQTDDGGRTWQQFGPPDAQPALPAFAADQRHGMAVFSSPTGGPYAVLATDDGGATWRPGPNAGVSTGPAHLAWINDRSWLLLTGSKAWRTDDGGANWTVSAAVSGAADVEVAAGHVWVLTNQGYCRSFKSDCGFLTQLFDSTDSGRTWRQIL